MKCIISRWIGSQRIGCRRTGHNPTIKRNWEQNSGDWANQEWPSMLAVKEPHSSKSISIFKLKESRRSLTASISLRSLVFLASEDPYDEEEATDEANLMEVSDKTHSFLSSACTRSLSNKQRKRIRGSILTTEDSSNQIPHYWHHHKDRDLCHTES